MVQDFGLLRCCYCAVFVCRSFEHRFGRAAVSPMGSRLASERTAGSGGSISIEDIINAGALASKCMPDRVRAGLAVALVAWQPFHLRRSRHLGFRLVA